MPRPSPRHANEAALLAFGESVRRRRLAINVSQEALADQAGLDRSYLSSVERGRQNIGLMGAVQLAQALELTLVQLVGDANL